jgi:hypothetical protein
VWGTDCNEQGYGQKSMGSGSKYSDTSTAGTLLKVQDAGLAGGWTGGMTEGGETVEVL